jgi:NodT family efflux transporter outer membrane factor (OMF) lipoprotein
MTVRPPSSTRTAAHWIRAGLGALAAAALAACASNPVPASATPPTAPAFRQSTQPEAFVDIAWWHAFGDERLASLVERAATANHDVRIAIERVRQARAGQTAAESRLAPTVNATGSASDAQSGLPDPVKRAGLPDTRALRLGLEASWEIDLFGGARAGASAADRDARAAAYGVPGAQLAVAGEVARQYFLLQGARERLAIVERLAQTQRDTERLTSSRQREGVASRFDLERASAEAESVAAQIPPLRTLVAVTEQRIAVLVGAPSVAHVPELAMSAAWQWTELPVVAPGQPAELLRRRPDLLAAERQLEAEGYRLDEARANRWPRLFASALFGREDLKLNALDLAPVRFSNVALAFSLPLFNAGRVQAGIDAQDARQRAAALVYERAVLAALEDVENSLVVMREERDRALALSATTTARRAALKHAEALYREGQIDLLQLLDAQRGVLSSELSQSESRAQEAIDVVQLYKALGGGWQRLPRVAAPVPDPHS